MHEPGIHEVVKRGEVSLKLTFNLPADHMATGTVNILPPTPGQVRSPKVLHPREIHSKERPFVISDPAQVGKDFEVYSGPLTINFAEFCKMVPGVGEPDLTILDKVRIMDSKTEIDTHFGLMDKPNVRVLLMLSEYMKPINALMIGTGRGLVDTLLAQTMSGESRLDTVDPGLNRVQQSETLVPVTEGNQRYIRYTDESEVGAYIREAEAQGLFPKGRVFQHYADSTEFFDKRAQKFREASPKERQEFKYHLIVIDGNHTYPQPEIDINYALGFLHQGGVLFIDDWKKLATNSGVTLAALELTHKLRFYLYYVGDIHEREGYQTGCVFMINSGEAFRPPLRRDVEEAVRKAKAFRDKFLSK